MCARVIPWMAVVACLFSSHLCLAEKVLFEDDFEDGLSTRWQALGLKKEDYRIRDGGLELRVQPGRLTRDTPMLKVTLAFTSSGIVVASVDVTILDRFTEPAEFAGLFLTAERGVEFGGKKERVDGDLVFSPGNIEFVGQPGEEGTLPNRPSSTGQQTKMRDRCGLSCVTITLTFKSALPPRRNI